ncbi:lytic transglycosylase domain-containing protein [Kovacikia minuta CCNUW1]|uniref:lytic transglycosylase domain-containing protein n=1 Tax=Kovacikia minuta TaxID=2931930 RepID=UPI001CCAAF20|nr:lytic transglycosylase domain-containing protein [Kovacikia minuta]UBF24977.1 lytic transglycosylase domain-containing protein [Kovacikia minuta CCNUW1]
MRNQKQKRRFSKQNGIPFNQRFRRVLGHCLTVVETVCDRSLVSKRRLHRLTRRPKLQGDYSHQRSDRFNRLRPQSHRSKPRGKGRRSLVFRFYPGGVFILSLLLFLSNPGFGAYSWKFTPPFLNQASNQAQPLHQSIPNETLTRLRAAIVQQESDGNHRLLNPSGSGAMGLAQVMPEDLPQWSQEALGREVSPAEFLENHDLQVVIIDHKLNQYWQEAILQAQGNEDEAILRIASWWYSGDPNLFTDTKPQFWNGDEYPSIADYCHQVLDRYKAMREEVRG